MRNPNITSNQTHTPGGWPMGPKVTVLNRCPWCADSQSEYEPVDPERELCHQHMNEYDGLSEDAEQARLAGEAYDSGELFR